MNPVLPSDPPLDATSQRVVLITGANSGIGFECARRLAREGWHVITASRDRAASAAAVRRIAEETGNPDVEEMGLDLGSLAAVRQFAREFLARGVPLHALVCNAGLQRSRGPTLTPDGFEVTIGVNHLGHFLLANLLLEKLRASAPARILVVASGVHDPSLRTGMPKASIPDVETLLRNGLPDDRPWDGRLAYVNSKLCNIWFSYELARRIESARLSSEVQPLSVNAYEPGLVPGSGLARDYPPLFRFVWNRVLPLIAPLLPIASTAQRSGNALAELVLDPALRHQSGKYFPSHTRFREGRSSLASYELEPARTLWEASVRATQLAPGESPLA